jgi:hypothetical protein
MGTLSILISKNDKQCRAEVLLRSLEPAPRVGGVMKKMIKIKVLVLLVAILTLTLAVSPAQACACGENWSAMSPEKIASEINNSEDQPRILEGESGGLPPAPEGYEYDNTFKLVPTK